MFKMYQESIYVPPHKRGNVNEITTNYYKGIIPNNRRRDLSQGSKFNTRQILPQQESKRILINSETIEIPEMIIPPILINKETMVRSQKDEVQTVQEVF